MRNATPTKVKFVMFRRLLIPRSYTTAATPPTKKSPSFLRRNAGKFTALLVVSGTAYLSYESYKLKNPLQQLPHDPTKKTVLVLGSGWAATSFLKDLDTENFNVVCVSPRNYFLFTPLLPSCTVGTVEIRSIMQPIRYLTRFKKRDVMFVEADCVDIDTEKKQISIQDNSELVGEVSAQTLGYDYLIVACGAENSTFGIPGVKENACFLKEIWDARKIRTRLMDCLETAVFPGQPMAEVERLLHMVVVGGGPTGIEYAAELHDFLTEDLTCWYPEIADKVKITLIEATPHVLPMFSKQLIEYTEKTFAENKVEILANTQVKEVMPKEIIVLNGKKEVERIPYGLLVWATGNTSRSIVSDLIKKIGPELQAQRRGLSVDDCLQVKGVEGVYALGDATATKYSPTAQVASKQGKYLADRFNRLGYLESDRSSMASAGVSPEEVARMLPPFTHKSMGMLAYIGSDKAIADFPGGVKLGGLLTFYFWRSAYLSNLFTWRNKLLVGSDWMKKTSFGRDIGRE